MLGKEKVAEDVSSRTESRLSGGGTFRGEKVPVKNTKPPTLWFWMDAFDFLKKHTMEVHES